MCILAVNIRQAFSCSVRSIANLEGQAQSDELFVRQRGDLTQKSRSSDRFNLSKQPE